MSTPQPDLAGLLALVTSGAASDAAVQWLETATGCTARLTTPGQPSPADLPADPDPADVAALREGRMRGPVMVAAPEGGGYLLICGAGTDPPPHPRPLLWAWRSIPWDQPAQAAAEQAAGVAASLVRARDVAAREAALSEALMGARVSALQALMAGDLVRAGRALAPLVPGLAAAGAGQVAIIELAAADDRSAVAREVDRLGHHQVLTVTCPVDDRQVIVLSPTGGPALVETVTPILTAGRAAGVSPITPWQRTAAAYQAASEALAQARGMATRIAVHDGRPPLVEVLGTDARVWAALVLQPVDDQCVPDRDEVYALAREVLLWGETAAARLLGWHRHTLARRMDNMSKLTGHDRSQLWHFASLWLAVNVAAQPPPPVLPGIVTLPDVLAHEGVERWAHRIVDPMPPPVRAAVAAWLEAEGRSAEAAAALGVARSTLHDRIQRAQALTHLTITKCVGSAAEIAIAMHVAGEITMGSLPDLSDRHLTARGGDITMQPQPEIDTSRPHPARVYDYLLGGRTHFAADREQAQQMQEHNPRTITVAQTNRSWMLRVARALPTMGVQQVLDLGSGIPTSPNLHEELLAAAPAGRVVYVDNDPIVLAHALELMLGTAPGQLAYVQADVTEGAEVLLDRPEVRETLDLTRPIALCAAALLHFLPGPAGVDLIRGFMARLAPGSMLVLSHLTADFAPELVLPGVRAYADSVAPLCVRSADELGEFFSELEMMPPGLVPPSEWRPEDSAAAQPAREHINMWAGVARLA